MKNIKLGFILMVFCVISAGMLAGVYLFTQPKIESGAKIAFEKSLNNVLPIADSFKEIKIGTGEVFYQGMKGDQIIGYVVERSPRGYSSGIRMVVGIDVNGKIVNISIIDQKETPGLGANVVKQVFLSQFAGKSNADKIEPNSDIDAISGATISTSAVCRGAKEALEKYLSYMEKNKSGTLEGF